MVVEPEEPKIFEKTATKSVSGRSKWKDTEKELSSKMKGELK